MLGSPIGLGCLGDLIGWGAWVTHLAGVHGHLIGWGARGFSWWGCLGDLIAGGGGGGGGWLLGYCVNKTSCVHFP